IQNGLIDEDSVLIPLASDGMDNSDSAGAVVDKNTIENIKKLNIDVKDALDRFDAYPVFQKSGDMIMTGPTGANVSDLMILLTKK
ncbi:MAG: Glycerate 2-kinase, partial [Candidatus Nomurabacteria bacterium GW2011_GWC2_35_8]